MSMVQADTDLPEQGAGGAHREALCGGKLDDADAAERFEAHLTDRLTAHIEMRLQRAISAVTTHLETCLKRAVSESHDAIAARIEDVTAAYVDQVLASAPGGFATSANSESAAVATNLGHSGSDSPTLERSLHVSGETAAENAAAEVVALRQRQEELESLVTRIASTTARDAAQARAELASELRGLGGGVRLALDRFENDLTSLRQELHGERPCALTAEDRSLGQIREEMQAELASRDARLSWLGELFTSLASEFGKLHDLLLKEGSGAIREGVAAQHPLENIKAVAAKAAAENEAGYGSPSRPAVPRISHNVQAEPEDSLTYHGVGLEERIITRAAALQRVLADSGLATAAVAAGAATETEAEYGTGFQHPTVTHNAQVEGSLTGSNDVHGVGLEERIIANAAAIQRTLAESGLSTAEQQEKRVSLVFRNMATLDRSLDARLNEQRELPRVSVLCQEKDDSLNPSEAPFQPRTRDSQGSAMASLAEWIAESSAQPGQNPAPPRELIRVAAQELVSIARTDEGAQAAHGADSVDRKPEMVSRSIRAATAP